MKFTLHKWVCIAFTTLLFAACSPAATVVFPLLQMQGTAGARSLTITLPEGVVMLSTNLVYGFPLQIWPSNGVASAALVAGDYNVMVDRTGKTFRIRVADTNSTLNAVDLVISGLTSASANPIYYTRAQVDALDLGLAVNMTNHVTGVSNAIVAQITELAGGGITAATGTNIADYLDAVRASAMTNHVDGVSNSIVAQIPSVAGLATVSEVNSASNALRGDFPVIAAGTNATVTTNGNVYTVSSTASGTGSVENPINGYGVTNAPYLHILDGPFVLQSSGLDPVSITSGDGIAEITGSLNVSATIRGATLAGNQSGITNAAGLTIAQQITAATNGLGSGSGDVTAAGDNVFTGTSNAFTGAVGIGTLNVNTQLVDVLEFTSLLGTLYGTNIAAGQIDTNHLTAAAYAALAGGGSITNPIDGYTITNAPSVSTASLIVTGSVTNVLGETIIERNFMVRSNLIVTGGTTNMLGYSIFTNGVSGDGSGWTGVIAAKFNTIDMTNTYQSTGFDPVYVSAGGDSELVVDGSINTGPWGVTSGTLTVGTNLTMTSGANPSLRVVAGSANTLVVTNGRVGILRTTPTTPLDVTGSIQCSGSFYTSLNVQAGGEYAFYHISRNRWYSPADGTMVWTKAAGLYATNILLSVTNGSVYVPTNLNVNSAIQVRASAAEPSAVPGYAQLYAATNAGVTELYVQGDDGTETQISPHADDAPATLYDLAAGDMKEIVWREVNPFLTNGRVSFINMRRMARITELNTRAILYLAGNNNSGMSNALVKLKDMSPAQRQVLMTETFPEYNSRTGRKLQPLIWEDVEQARQVAYDAERKLTLEAHDRILAENLAKEAAKDTNIVELPTIPPDVDVRRPKPAWMN